MVASLIWDSVRIVIWGKGSSLLQRVLNLGTSLSSLYFLGITHLPEWDRSLSLPAGQG